MKTNNITSLQTVEQNQKASMIPVEEVDGWFVMTSGKIYSTKAGRILKGRVLKSGYIQVGTARSGKVKLYREHILVCRAFHGKPPTSKHTVNHINFNKQDNRPENLEWVTIQENIHKSVVAGRRIHRISSETIKSIRDEYKPWDKLASASVLAKKYGVHRSYVLSVVKNKNRRYA